MNLSSRVVSAMQPDHTQSTLADLPLGSSATVAGVVDRLDPAAARRLFDLGFSAGTPVQALRKTPLGGPRIYRVGDYDLALRTEQARAVVVEQAA